MDDQKKPPANDEVDENDTPEERAFTGHPDHPPSSPDQSLEANEELLDRPDKDDGDSESPRP